MGISGQIIWRQTGNFLRKQKIIRKITYYESGFMGQNTSVFAKKVLLSGRINLGCHFLLFLKFTHNSRKPRPLVPCLLRKFLSGD